ncbi:MAG: hypothetical protein IRY91_17380 [Gemmatimonadaceae bacterium]|nr:hypothetical protein [Gemmatimonadaceae bacterium]
MFFRGRQPETSIWKRFRSAADGFSFAKEADYYVAHLVANAERVVDLFVALLEHMPPAVDVAVTDARTHRAWKGERLALPDVRDALARIKPLLAAHGGVEIAVYTSEDQLTLNSVLELFIYARTDQWLYLLKGKGLEERRLVHSKSWRLAQREFPDAPELVQAIAALAVSLQLSPA